jgi:hypothetical protein
VALALAGQRRCRAWPGPYCDNFKSLPVHLPDERKADQFLTVPPMNDVAAIARCQAFNPINSYSIFPTSFIWLNHIT